MLSSPTDALTQQQQTQAQIISLMNATDNIMPQMSPVQMINSQQQKCQIFTTPVNTPSISYGDYLSGNGGGVSVLQSTAPTFTDASLNAPLSSSVTNASTSASTNKRLSLSAKSPHIPLGNTNSPKTNPTSDSLSRSKSHSRKSISIMKSPHIPLGGSLYSVDSLPSASPSYPAHQLQSPLAGLGDSFQGMYMQSPTLSLHSSNYDSPDLPFNETESSGGSKKKREFRCTVEGCDKTFTRRYNLKSHHLSIHTRERPYACPECTQSFARQHDLKRHVKSVHTDNRPHACPHCTLTFSRSDALKRHLAVETKKMQMEGLPIGSPVTKILNGSGVTPGTSPYVPPGSGKMYMVGPSPAFSMGDEEIDDREDHMEALDAALDADPEETMKQIMMAVGGSGAINNQNNGGMQQQQQQILNDFNFAVPYPKN
ncbi:hypothetical protein HK098_001552 [Nowakowskiella sp. JEL0407]|nr:hypothetical protein HK098_001552 [Nowakowskiella sp. JEL0407]